jgi:hypothetical protein
MTKKMTQGHRLEVLRGDLDMSQTEFCEAIGVSRQWYSGQLKKKRDVLGVKDLSTMALDHAGDWVGQMAVALLIDGGNERFIPCVCQTEIGDSGLCPKPSHRVVISSQLSAVSFQEVAA